jgi:hypothetical protein
VSRALIRPEYTPSDRRPGPVGDLDQARLGCAHLAQQRHRVPDLSIRARDDLAGRKPVYTESNLAIFQLPPRNKEVRLLSRAQSPTEGRPWLDDRRRLGLRVKRIVLRGANERHDIPIDCPGLTAGWWDIERDGQMMSRWTDGAGVAPLPAMHGHVMLKVHLAGEMVYAVRAEPAYQADRCVA